MLSLLPPLIAALALAAEPPPGARWQARRAEYTLHRQEDGSFLLDGAVELGALDAQAAVLPWLTGEGLLIEGTGGVASVGVSHLELVLPGTGSRADGSVRARITPTEGALTINLGVVAALQRVRVDAPGFDVTIDDARGGAVRGGTLVVHVAPHVERSVEPETALALGEVSAAAWGTDDGAVASRARLRWRVVRGEMDTFRIDVGALQDVELTGPNVTSWSRSGSIVTVVAKTPVRGAFVVDLEGRRATPTGNFPLPAPVPLDVSRVDRWWTLGRAAEGELLPVSAPTGIAGRTLPEWARGLADTPPLAFWHGNTDVTLRSSPYNAVMGPDTVVEAARFVVATNDDGRLLLRATWQVRNERSQYLHVVPGAGWRPMTARVTGDPVSVLADGQGGVYVPLEKSIETRQGLLTFPVEVTWIVDGSAFARRGAHEFRLPAVDAPIQRADWEVHLPRGYERIGAGATPQAGASPPVGDAWGDGRAGDEDGRVADQERLDTAEAAMSNATRAYQKNDFEAAQEWLATAKEAAPEDQNVDRLQSNLDVLLGGTGSEDAGARRVLDLANAKTLDAQNEQAVVEEKAAEALRNGDDLKAIGYLQQASQLSSSIALTEQAESGEQKDRAEAYKAKVEVAKKQISARGASITPILARANDVPNEDDDSMAQEVAPVEISDPITFTAGQTLTTEYLERVSTGRSYQSGVGRAATKATSAPTTPASAAPVRGRPALSPKKAADTPAQDAYRPTAPGEAAAGPAPPPPPPPPGRTALVVTASPLTPALPLGTPALTNTSALLPPGQHPTFSIRYRRIPGEPR